MIKACLNAAAVVLSTCHIASANGMSETMLDFGNQRTALYALLTERPEGAAPVVHELGRRLGVMNSPDGKPYLASSYIAITPLLQYDHNTNGGSTFNSFDIYGFNFTVNDEDIADPDLTAGAAMNAGAALAIGSGVTIGADVQFSYRKGIEHGHKILENAQSINIQKTFNEWNYLSGSLTRVNKDVSLSETEDMYAILTAGRIWGNVSSINDLSASFVRFYDQQNFQSRGRLDWEIGRAEGFTIKSAAEIGEKIDGAHLPTTSLQAKVYGNIYGKSASLGFGYIKESGGYFINQSRSDEIYALSTSYQFKDSLGLYISFEGRKSSVKELSTENFNMGLTWKPFVF